VRKKKNQTAREVNDSENKQHGRMMQVLKRTFPGLEEHLETRIKESEKRGGLYNIKRVQITLL